MSKRNKLRWLRNVQIALYSTLAVFAVAVSICLLPGLQPSGYTTSPAVCPERETDSRGYCFIHRDNEYQYLGPATIVHISRSSGPKGKDTIFVVTYSHGRFYSFSQSSLEPYPPQNRVDAFVQSVRDRRTELYSDMHWPDPNPHPMTPQSR